MRSKYLSACFLSLAVAAGAMAVLAWDEQRRLYPPPEMVRVMDKLRPLQRPLPDPQPGDWLSRHDEPGQTFRDYLRSRPTMPTDKRRVIYVQPLGDFTPTQRKIVDLSADFMGRYFGLPVKIADNLPLSLIPASARRVHPEWGVRQVLTTYVLDEVLSPKLPDDAMAYIAFTASDLWPGEGWNFVFGQASLQKRVGVWSIARNGDPGESEEAFRLCLLRTLKTATHETGHMFSLPHCTAYLCNMNGSNSQGESDRHPLWLCPECMAKVVWASKLDPLERYKKLKEFCEEQGLKEEAGFYGKAFETLGAK